MSNKIKITKEDILNNPEEIILIALTTDDEFGINMVGTGKELLVIIKVGGNNDWAAYANYSDHSINEVAISGQKIMVDSLNNVFEFNEEVKEMYRR